ncbi:MAG: carboxypeptidase M32 [candidate division Zixibacteria bacterium]|nr:carboxypeptidase M32 [candidate division Zixibacteria bacterium]
MPGKYEELYDELIKRNQEIAIIGSCAGLLGWDERTYMPRSGAQARANQIAYLSGLAHQKFTDPKIGELLKELEQSPLAKDELSDSAVNIREIRDEYDKLIRVPQKLVEEISHTTTMAQGIWTEARAKSDFAKFLPWLEKIIKLELQLANCLGYKKEAYDALLDNYEPGSTYESVVKVFAEFRKELVDLVATIKDSKRKPDLSIIEREYPVDRQAIFGQAAADAIGFDFASGRLDVTTHPFCSGISPGDTRITTRYSPRHFSQAFFGILHEAGHGIYDQGLDKGHFGTPRGHSVSLGIHESQSRMWENFVGRSKPFWKHFLPLAQKTFPEALKSVAFDDFYFAINDVRPSYIRVEADEVSYNLHILLRFELESALLKGDLSAADLPGAWNEKFEQFFGIAPKNDAEGCLQDVHWSCGYIGYFPTYTLGNLYAAQFFAKVREDIKDLDRQFAVGNFSGLKTWLNKNIHTHGKKYRAQKLVQVVTGQPLSHKPLISYLRTKYGELYGF